MLLNLRISLKEIKNILLVESTCSGKSSFTICLNVKFFFCSLINAVKIGITFLFFAKDFIYQLVFNKLTINPEFRRLVKVIILEVSFYEVFFCRWWVAGHAVQHHHIPVTENTLKDSKDTIKKLRLTIKFLLGNLDSRIPDVDQNMNFILDQYMLHKLFEFFTKVRNFIYEYITLWSRFS